MNPNEVIDSLLEYFVKHRTTWEEISDIAKIINKTFGAKILPDTKYFLQKIFSKGSQVTLFFACSVCGKLGFKTTNPNNFKSDQCAYCSSTVCEKNPTFVTFPLRENLENLLKAHAEKFTFHDCAPSAFPMEDFFNSKSYRDAVTSEGPIIAIGLNSDGVQKFNKSKNSMYPIFVQVYNLNKTLRQRPENMLIYGLFNGKNLPAESIIEPLTLELQEINNNGGINSPIGKLPVLCLTAAMDSVARPKFQQHHQFNGEYGCFLCYNKGTQVGGSMKYPNM